MNKRQLNCKDLLFVDGDHRECGHYFKQVTNLECSRCTRPLKLTSGKRKQIEICTDEYDELFYD